MEERKGEMKKEDLFEKLKRNTHVHCDMPDMNMTGIVYDDPLAQFCEIGRAHV